MDKAALNKKSKAQLETLAKKIGANVKTPEGKVKTKTQLVNSIIMKNRLNGGKAKPAKKATKRTMAAKENAGKYAVIYSVGSSRASVIYQRKGQKTKWLMGTLAGIAKQVDQLKNDGFTKIPYRDIKL